VGGPQSKKQWPSWPKKIRGEGDPHKATSGKSRTKRLLLQGNYYLKSLALRLV